MEESFNNELDEYEARKQKEFYDKFPLLFPKHPHWNTKRETQEPECGFSCDYGWWDLLKKLCSDLTKLLEESGLPEEDKIIPIDQIKEKFSGVRIYFGSFHESLNDKVYALVREAEEKSFKICETCGQPGEKRSGGWLKVRCDSCQEKLKEINKCIGQTH
jgi:hypothetical protein